jgi:hypothetical protein
MSLEYAIFVGTASQGVTDLEDLENRINHVISKGGTTVGGLFITSTKCYQAVMQPVGYDYTNSPNNNSPKGGRRTRKNRK